MENELKFQMTEDEIFESELAVAKALGYLKRDLLTRRITASAILFGMLYYLVSVEKLDSSGALVYGAISFLYLYLQKWLIVKRLQVAFRRKRALDPKYMQFLEETLALNGKWIEWNDGTQAIPENALGGIDRGVEFPGGFALVAKNKKIISVLKTAVVKGNFDDFLLKLKNAKPTQFRK
jgi:hypothetical protein